MLVQPLHRSIRFTLFVVALAALLLTTLALPPGVDAKGPKGPQSVRFATYNASLNRSSAGLAQSDLSQPFNPAEPDAALRLRRSQAANVAEVIQRTRPDVLLVNEFDFAPATATLPASIDSFRDNYLEVPQNGAAPIDYPYAFWAPSNTGVYSGKDLDNSGAAGDFVPNDSFGFGFFPGQFGMAVYSMYPIDHDAVRTFQFFLWKDMPGALLPDDPAVTGPADWYSPDELEIFRLSSKSHWDVPIDIGGTTVHFLVSHPTPPVFDGAEDRNGTRNHDEIRFWADYVMPGAGGYIYDDDGVHGGLQPGAKFVIAGDQNSDPLDGDSIPGSIQQLTEHPLINTKVTPSSAGAADEAVRQGGANTGHESPPQYDTADFNDAAPGNLRADYVLPRKNLRIQNAGVFWPLRTDPLFRLTGVFDFALISIGGFPTSDHRLVWVDVNVPGAQRGH